MTMTHDPQVAEPTEAEHRVAALVEDVEWLVESGEPLERILRATGYTTVRGLDRYLRRHGHPDVARAVAATNGYMPKGEVKKSW